MARVKSIVEEARQIDTAIELIKLGARLQVLEAKSWLPFPIKIASRRSIGS